MEQSRSENDLAAIYDAMACGVVVRNAAGAVVFANAAAKRIFGRPPDELEGGEAPGEDRRVREDGAAMPDGEVPHVAAQARGEPIRNVMMGMVRADGYVRWLLVDAVPVKDAFGRVREVVSSFTDVTDRKKAEHELERQALHDTLTGLPNRSLLLDRLEQALRTARRLATPLALLVMDLDRFKEINDTFGHRAGDLLIGEVAHRITADLRETDTLARLGGDEVAVILPGADEGGAGHVAQKIIGALQRPFEIEGGAHEVAISIGIAVSPQHGEDVETLMRRADMAMYVAKTTPGGSAVYAEQQDPEGSNQLAMMAELRHTLETDQLQVVYQPIVGFVEGEVMRVEVLARWRHPQRGLIARGEFIPLAERSGLVKSLFSRVLAMTLAQCAEWKLANLPVQAAVNLSIRNLLDPELPRVIGQALEHAGIPPEWLPFEITQSMLMGEPNRVPRTLAQVRGNGGVDGWRKCKDYGRIGVRPPGPHTTQYESPSHRQQRCHRQPVGPMRPGAYASVTGGRHAERRQRFSPRNEPDPRRRWSSDGRTEAPVGQCRKGCRHDRYGPLFTCFRDGGSSPLSSFG